MVVGCFAGLSCCAFARRGREQSDAKLRADCRHSARVVQAYDQAVVRSAGRMTERDGKLQQRNLAAQRLLGCGAFGGLTAAWSIRETRMLADTTTLRKLVAVFGNFRDTAVVNAAMSVASDPAASVPARVYALRTIWVLRKGNAGIAYEQLLPWEEFRGEWSARCEIGVNVVDGHPFWTEGATLPPGFESDLRAFARRLAFDRSQPVEVRTAAKCATQP